MMLSPHDAAAPLSAGHAAASKPWAPPPGPDTEMQSAGVAWDAVKAPAYVGDRALSRLGEGSGAVIRDGWSHHLYWLVRTGSAVGWDLLPVTVLGAATYVAVPPAGRTRSFGVHWALPPTADRRLTDAALLHDALAAAVAVSLDRHGAGVER